MQGDAKVWPDGARHAKIALVGEGPGAVETTTGIPFSGPSGGQLDWFLQQAKIDRRSLWISNVALCEPRYVHVPELNLTWGKKRAMLDSCGVCRPRLLQELAQVRPRVIVALGNEALEALTGERGVLARHGALHRVDLLHLAGVRATPSPLDADATWVLPCFHPAAVLREQRWSPGVVQVLQKANRIAREGVVADAGRFLLVSPYVMDPAAALLQLEQVVEQIVVNNWPIAFDVETPIDRRGSRAAPLTIFGFGCGILNLGVSVAVKRWDHDRSELVDVWRPPQLARVYAALGRLMRSPVKKWAWNLAYDFNVSRRCLPSGIVGPFDDGLHYHWAWQPDLPHGLGFVSQSLLDVEAWKVDFNARKATARGATYQDEMLYNGKDALHTAWLIPKLEALVDHVGMRHLVGPYQLGISDLANRAYLRGLPVNAALWTELRAQYVAECDTHRAAMIAAIVKAHGAASSHALSQFVHQARIARARTNAVKYGRAYKEPKFAAVDLADFNPKAPDQAMFYLFDTLGLEPQGSTKGGEDGEGKRPSISYKIFLDYLGRAGVAEYVKYAEFKKRVETLDSIRAHCDSDTLGEETWWLHPSWNDTTQKNTRFTSNPNVQNLEKKMRKLIKAPPGYVFVGADAAQIEYRVAALFAGIQELLDIFNQEPFDEVAEPWKKHDPRYDAHALVAAEIFGDGYLKAEPSDQDAMRTMVKRVVYGLFYGAMPKKIVATLREDRRLKPELRAFIKLAMIEQIHGGFQKRFKEWPQWCTNEVRVVRKRGYQEFGPYSRRRWWPVRDLEETKLRNTPIQIAAGDVCNTIFKAAQARCDAEQLDATFVHHGHDSCAFLTREMQAQRVQAIVNEEFHFYLKGDRGRQVHIYGQARIGASLADV